jgi:two-component system, OmpR family, sensor kinase
VKRPLFWKLLLSSWLTLVLVAIGNAWLFRFAARAFSPWVQESLQRYETRQLDAAAGLLHELGRPGFDAFVRTVPSDDNLQLLPGIVERSPAGAPYDRTTSRIVHTEAGDATLVYKSSAFHLLPPRPRDLSRLPGELLLIDFVAISVFTVLFAKYLARPLQVLRTGIERVAAGDLNVRVYRELAPRRDEMADLARTFDLMAERIQQLLHARERLLHDVSHELRSPLTRLRLAVDLATQNPSRSRESLDRVEHETQRLSDLVDELLNLSRAEFNAAKSETYFAVAELVAAVTEDAKFEAQANGVDVQLKIPEHFADAAGPVINGSPELLRKAFDNVLRNAVKVSQKGQRVIVEVHAVSPGSGLLRISVSDNGPGVPTNSLERIFEPFVRLNQQPPSSGYGLGLAIAKSAAQAHRGAVWAQNRPEGGLCIEFELPVERPDWGEQI